MQDQKLMDYFQFNESDLEANRQGQFTEKQRSGLVEGDKSRRKNRLILGSLFAFTAAIGIIIAIVLNIQNPDPGSGIVFGGVWLLIWGGLGALFLTKGFSKHEFKLEKADGHINIVKKESYTAHGGEYSYHELRIGGEAFDVDGDLVDVIMRGDTCAVYYAENSANFETTILSAELISKAK